MRMARLRKPMLLRAVTKEVNMEAYETPFVEIVMIDTQDILTTSCTTETTCPQENTCETETEQF